MCWKPGMRARARATRLLCNASRTAALTPSSSPSSSLSPAMNESMSCECPETAPAPETACLDGLLWAGGPLCSPGGGVGGCRRCVVLSWFWELRRDWRFLGLKGWEEEVEAKPAAVPSAEEASDEATAAYVRGTAVSGPVLLNTMPSDARTGPLPCVACMREAGRPPPRVSGRPSRSNAMPPPRVPGRPSFSNTLGPRPQDMAPRRPACGGRRPPLADPMARALPALLGSPANDACASSAWKNDAPLCMGTTGPMTPLGPACSTSRSAPPMCPCGWGGCGCGPGRCAGGCSCLAGLGLPRALCCVREGGAWRVRSLRTARGLAEGWGVGRPDRLGGGCAAYTLLALPMLGTMGTGAAGCGGGTKCEEAGVRGLGRDEDGGVLRRAAREGPGGPLLAG